MAAQQRSCQGAAPQPQQPPCQMPQRLTGPQHDPVSLRCQLPELPCPTARSSPSTSSLQHKQLQLLAVSRHLLLWQSLLVPSSTLQVPL